MPRNNYDCCFFMCVIIEIVLIGVTINYSLKYNDSLKYNQLKCNINDKIMNFSTPSKKCEFVNFKGTPLYSKSI